MPDRPASPPAPRVLVTAGPTHEPIDAVRFVGNRSSGRMGLAIAAAAAARGLETTLLLGPIPAPEDLGPAAPWRRERAAAEVHGASPVRLVRFRSSLDLEARLAELAPAADLVIMAAAVADFRPPAPREGEKIRRTTGRLVLELEPVPDLLAGLAARRRDRDRAADGPPAGQRLVGFALEPAAELEASAAAKMRRKGIDAIVANPLETMDATAVTASLLLADGSRHDAPPDLAKSDFGAWLVDAVLEHLVAAGA